MPERTDDVAVPDADEQPARPAPTSSPPGLVAGSVRDQGVWDAVGGLVRRRQAELGRPLRVLDLGGGSGGLAVPLARLGHTVTVVDPSPNALAALDRRAAEAGVADRVTGRQGDADSPTSGAGDPVDLVCCHGVLEVVDDPATALSGMAAALAPGGYLSLVVAGRLAAVLARALVGDLAAAREALTSADGRWGRGDPLPRRFDTDEVVDLLTRAGLAPERVEGVRVFTDLVPPSALDSAAGRAAVTELERAVATHPRHAETLGHLGAALHAVARRA